MLELVAVPIVILLILVYSVVRRPKHFPPGPPAFPLIGSIPFIRFPSYKGFASLGKKYGDIFSVYIGTYPVVVINNWQLAREAYNDPRFSGRPDLPIFKDRSFGMQRGIFFGTGPFWVEQRRFTVKHLRDFGFSSSSMECIINTEVADLIKEFQKNVGSPFSLEFGFNCATLNALWFIVAGRRYNHGDPRLNEIVDVIYRIFSDIDRQGAVTFLPWLTKIAPKMSGWQSIMDGLRGCYTFLEDIIKDHKDSLDPSNPRDFIDIYLHKISETHNPGSSFFKDEGEKQLLVVLLDLFVAATDTVSTTLSWAFLYLITHPHIQTELQEEIETAIGQGRQPSLTDRPGMHKMEAFIAEILRITSVGTIFPHSTNETLEFHGYTIPQGTTVFANLWQIHHEDSYWGDPLVFRMERFLKDDGTFRKSESLLAFSYGKRICPGENMARDELFLFLTGLLQAFQFTGEQKNPSLQATDTVIPRPQKYNVILKSNLH